MSLYKLSESIFELEKQGKTIVKLQRSSFSFAKRKSWPNQKEKPNARESKQVR